MEHELRPPGDSRVTPPPANAGQSGGKKTTTWVLFTAAIAMLLVVIWVLPALVPEAGDGQKTAKVEPKSSPSDDQLLTAGVEKQQRADAEKALQDFLRLQAQPDLNNAEIWSAESWTMAMDTALQGDESFGEGRFAAALELYQSAGSQLQALIDNRDQLQQQSLADGWLHLQNNLITDASATFERVLAMHADNQQAQSGLARAAVRREVLELFDAGQQAEVAANLQLAARAYFSALQLDPLYVPAKEALVTVENALNELAFQDAMGEALRALDDGNFASAEKALNEAAKISPDEQVVKNVRQRLLSARRQDGLMKLRVKSEQSVINEQWTAAIQSYQQALAIDSKASFAVNGLTRAQKKQRLHQQLDHYLADTTRLFSDEPLNNAGQLLAVNQSISKSEPILAGKIARLQEAVRLAKLPVDLLILSDNLTEVTIYKVGRLGIFEQKELSLRPGKYTITGSRQGFKDVLKVIELEPGSNGRSLQIRSEESI